MAAKHRHKMWLELVVLPKTGKNRLAALLNASRFAGKQRHDTAAVEDRLQQRAGPAFCRRCPKIRRKQGLQRLDSRRRFALLEPQIHVPLAPGVVVGTGENEALR